MLIQKLDHVSIRTTDVSRSVDFYSRVLDLVTGPRPPFNFPGAWLYAAGADGAPSGGAIVHIIGIDPKDASGLKDYLGDRTAAGQGTGSFDHVALSATDIEAMRGRLAAAGLPFRERTVPLINMRQVFVDDPDGVTIELNFPA